MRGDRDRRSMRSRPSYVLSCTYCAITYPRWLFVALTASHCPACPILGMAVSAVSRTVRRAPAFSLFTLVAPIVGCWRTASPPAPTPAMTTTCKRWGAEAGGVEGTGGVEGAGEVGTAGGVEAGTGAGVGVLEAGAACTYH